MKKILVIMGHTSKTSFSSALCAEYIKGAKQAGHEVKLINLIDLKFDPILRLGNQVKQELEPDLLQTQELIKWADHLVFVYPTWWVMPPALVKGFVDRAISSGFAFKYIKTQVIPKYEKYLTKKSARLIVTMDTPVWYYKYFLFNPGGRMMKQGVLEFCGVGPVYENYFGIIKHSSDIKRNKWLMQCFNLGLRE